MKQSAKSRLAGARELLLSSWREDTPRPRLESLEEVSRALLERFQATTDTAFFEAFYSVTAPLFTAYSIRVIKRIGARIEEMSVTNRLYTIIFQKLTVPREHLPLDYLLPWCYKAIANVAREEKRRSNPRGATPADAGTNRARESTVERLIRLEDEERREKILQKVLEILYGGEVGFSPRDRRVMRLFYLERRTLLQIAAETNLTQSNVGVILKRTREKIARLVRSRL